MLDPQNPEAWTERPHEELFSLGRDEVEQIQLAVMRRRLAELRPSIDALDKLAKEQGTDSLDDLHDVVPLLFDHRVYKSYPISLIEKRNFKRLTSWLNRLTTHDLTSVSLDGVDSVDDWLIRLDESGMIIGHSTGTTGKLSFIPRSQVEWPAWRNAHFLAMTAALGGIDVREVKIPQFSAGYRSGHQMMTKMGRLMAQAQAGGEKSRHMLYDYQLSSDLLSLAGRLQAAEEAGELDTLEIDPKIIEERRALIENGKHRDEDLRQWFAKLVEEFRGQRVRIGGTSADLVRLALDGTANGIQCDFAPGSILMAGGGFKGYKDRPDDWQDLLKDFFGIDRIASMYGMSECMGTAPKCDAEYYHFLPYTVPIILDEDARPLPREGKQTGRMVLFDLLAATYWGGFISGDRVNIYWDEDCPCGWKGPRIDGDIQRFSEMEGGDDKITCAGTAKAYNDFMDYVGGA